MEKVLKNRFKQLISGKNHFIPNLSKLFPQGFTQLIFYKKSINQIFMRVINISTSSTSPKNNK